MAKEKKAGPPPIGPRKKTSGGRGKWVDPLIVHDDIRFGTTTVRPVNPESKRRATSAPIADDPYKESEGDVDPYAAVGRSKKTQFWHGGFAGLGVGDSIWPRTELARRGIRPGDRGMDGHDNVVFITDDRELARSYAVLLARGRRGDLYEVSPRPASSLRVDPDLPAVGLMASHAVVVDVAERDVVMTFEEAIQPAAKHLTWADDSPSYTADGYVTVAPEWSRARPEQVASLGQWIPHVAVVYAPKTGRCLINWSIMNKYVERFPDIAKRIRQPRNEE